MAVIETQTLAVASFVPEVREWGEVPPSPFLHDLTGGNIYTAVDCAAHKYFTFNPSTVMNVQSAKIKIYAVGSNITRNTGVLIYLWDGSSWQYVEIFKYRNWWEWQEVDVTAILDAPAKINGARIYLVSWITPGFGITVDQAILEVVGETPVGFPVPKPPLRTHFFFLFREWLLAKLK